MRKASMGVMVLAAIAVSLAAGPAAGASTTVFASIAPQKYFIEQIAGSRIEVRIMVTPGANPATYEPKPRQMIALSDAAAYFAIGVPFEGVWLDRIAAANPAMRIVHTDRGIEKLPMARHPHAAGNTATSADRHTDGAADPHIWTSPPLVMIQARHILTALIRIDPARREEYEDNYRRFIRELVELDVTLLRLFSGRERIDRFLVFHPSWGYFARAYGLEQIPIELEGKAPKPSQLTALIEEARQLRVRVVFAQPQFSAQSARIVAREIDGQVVLADPLAADWAQNLRNQAEAFRLAME